MSIRNQLVIFFAVGLAFGALTYVLLPSAQEPSHLALDCFSGALNNLPFHKIENTIYLAAAALFLYPSLLRPLVVGAYSKLPPRLRFIPRKFIAASNVRLLLLALMFSAFAGVFVAAGIFDSMYNHIPFINRETLLGMFCVLFGLLFLNMQVQMAEIREALKRRGLLEAALQIVMLLVGVLAFGHVFLG